MAWEMNPGDLDSARIVGKSTSCIECGREFPLGELMQFREFYACAECKPEVVRKLGAGLPFGRLWRHGRKLVASLPPDGHVHFPDCCIVCQGYSGSGPFVRTASLNSTGFRDGGQPAKVTWQYRYCVLHYRTYLWISVLSILGGIAGLLCVFAAAYWHLAFALGIFAGFAVMAFASTLLSCPLFHRASGDYVFFTGCSRKFLRSLPPWPGK